MGSFRPTVFLAFLAAGCSGQNVQGAWRGPFPLAEGKACETHLKGDRSVSVECGGTALVGAGRYDWDGSTLTLDLTALTRDGQKVRAPEPMRFKVRGEGNTLRMAYGGEAFAWARKPY